MPGVQEFKTIQDFLRGSDLGIDARFPDFLVFRWQDVTNYHCLDNMAYRSRFFEITYLEQSSHSLQVDHHDSRTKEETLFFISPYRLQSCGTGMDETTQGYTVLFTPEFIGSHTGAANAMAFFHHFNSPALVLQDEGRRQFDDLFEKIHAEYSQTGTPYSRDILHHYVLILLLKGQQHYAQPTLQTATLTREQSLYDQFMALVQQRFIQWHNVKDYASPLGVSAKHLSETVKKISGQSALQIIHSVRVHHAKSLLRQSNMTVAEIAYALQFENPDYFSVFFKRVSGETPGQFRNS